MKLIKKILFFFLKSLWILFLLSIIVLPIRSCYKGSVKRREAKDARERKELREKYVKDSLANDPHYQDSIRKERDEFEKRWKEREEWRNKHTMVITCDTDSIYHTTTDCNNLITITNINSNYFFGTKNIDCYRLTTLFKADSLGYLECPSCEKAKDVLQKYENCEMVDFEDVPRIAKEYFDMIDTNKDNY